jgi:hypothetical protein
VMPLRSLGMWIGQAQRATASGEADLPGPRRAGGDRRQARGRSSCRRETARSASRTSPSPTCPGAPCSRASTSR